jgi:hypothetical protein
MSRRVLLSTSTTDCAAIPVYALRRGWAMFKLLTFRQTALTLRISDPESVVRGVAKSLKPGGVFAIQEYMHYTGILLAPESKAWNRFVEIVAAAWNEHGGDTNVGMKLPGLLAKHGLNPVEISPLHRVARPHSQLWTWPTIFIDTYAPKLVEEGRMTKAEHEALVNDWRDRTNNPNAFFCSPPMVDIIAVKHWQ